MFYHFNFCDRRSSTFIKSLYQEWDGLEHDDVDEDEKKHSEEEVRYKVTLFVLDFHLRVFSVRVGNDEIVL